MTPDERQHLEQMVDIHLRNLRKLEIDAANYGPIGIPLPITNQMTLLREQIVILTEQLRPQPVDIDLFSFRALPSDDPGRIRVDWTDFFRNGLPDSDVWDSTLLPMLHNLIRQLDAGSSRRINLRAKAHLSAGLAFGYVFRATSGFHIWVEQEVPHQPPQSWRTDAPPANETSFAVERTLIDPERTDITIELSIAPDSDVRATVDRYLAAHALPIRERIQVAPSTTTSAPAIRDGAHALAAAHQVRSAIKDARNAAPPGGVVHLFGAIPIGLAVLIGTQLNTCEPVQSYEFDRSTHAYRPACRLTPGEAPL